MPENLGYESNFADFALKTILDSTKDMIFIKDANLIYCGSSSSFAKLVGLSSSEELIGKTDFDIFADVELAKRYTQDDKRMMDSKKPMLEYIEPLPAIDGRPRYSSTSKHLIADSEGNVIGLCGISRDITREYEARVNYERELRYLFELPPDALTAALFDITSWRIVDLRSRTDQDHIVSNYATVDEFIADARQSVVADEDALEFFQSFSRHFIYGIYESGQRNLELEYLRNFPNGESLWVKNEFHFLIDPVNGHLSALSILFDIDQAKRSRDEIQRAAENDCLTGLLNREATMKYIESFLQDAGNTGTHALFLIDIDNFKMVNDTFGHQVGDKIITEIATLIKGSFRETDIVGRIGGDEFFVFMKDVDSQRTVRRKAQGLVCVLQHVCATPASKVELSASIGISLLSGANKTLAELYKEADLALYHSKECGKNQFFVYTSSEAGPKSLIPQMGDLINTVNLHALLNKIDAGIIIHHANSKDKFARPIFISESFLEMVGGLTLEEGFELYNCEPGQTIHPQDRERVWDEYHKAMLTDKSFRSIHRVVGKGGVYYQLSMAANIIMNADGSMDTYSVYTSVEHLP